MRRWGLALGVVFLLVGGVWVLQGAGWLRGSFMTGQRLWLGIGIVLVLAGVLSGLWGLRRETGRR